MEEQKKILILTGNYGDGHLQVAKAIHDASLNQYPEYHPVIYDLMEWAHPYTNTISRYVYFQGVKNFPQVYGFLYQKTRKANSLSRMVKVFFSSGMKRILKLIKEVKPAIVVSTFPLAAAVMSKLKTCGLTSIPTITIITDHTDHSAWIYPYTDQYIVGSSLVRDLLIRLGVDPAKISDTGIPIRPEFSQSYQRKEISRKYGIDLQRPTILVMGGGSGMIGDGEATIQALNEISLPLQFIIVCGHNEKLRLQLSQQVPNPQHLIHLTGYIDYVHEIMAASDVMITKPGGVTTFEAIAMELPMLLYRPIPGQEQDNARFLIRTGVAMQADSSRDISTKLVEMINNRELLQQMRENTKRFHPKESIYASLNVIVQAMNRENSRCQKTYSIISYSG